MGVRVEGRGPSMAEVAAVSQRDPNGPPVSREGQGPLLAEKAGCQGDLGAAGACSRGCGEGQRSFCVTERMSAHQPTYSELGSGHALSGTQRRPPRMASLERKTCRCEQLRGTRCRVCRDTGAEGDGEERVGQPEAASRRLVWGRA